MSGQVRGWCPSLHRPMESGDGLLLRVKPPGAVLQARDARTLARAAKLFGNGTLGLTNRGHLQFRGFDLASAPGFAGIVVALGLAEAEAGAEARRSVVVSPLHGVDPGCHIATLALAQALEQTLARHDDWPGLGAKFCIVVDGGGDVPVSAVPGDLVLQLVGADLLISPGDHPRAARVTLEHAVAAIDRLIGLMLTHCGRMRDADIGALFPAAGLLLGEPRRPSHSPIRAGHVPGGFAFGVTAGLLCSEQLTALADLADAQGCGELRLSPHRGIILPGVSDAPDEVPQGLLIHPDDPALRAHTCPGAPFCASASVATQSDLPRLLGLLGDWRGELHLSGCSKGCAHPACAGIVLTGENGLYRLVRDGRADGRPVAEHLTLEQAARMLHESSPA